MVRRIPGQRRGDRLSADAVPDGAYALKNRAAIHDKKMGTWEAHPRIPQIFFGVNAPCDTDTLTSTYLCRNFSPARTRSAWANSSATAWPTRKTETVTLTVNPTASRATASA